MSSSGQKTWGSWLDTDVGLLDLSDNLKEEWKPSNDDARAAWQLYTELRTRIATQLLPYRAGDERTALDSLYKLFPITRAAIKENGPNCEHFATLAIAGLNQLVRPFTAIWHKKLIDGVLQNDDDRREFRQGLRALQLKLRSLARVLGRLAKGNGFVDPDLSTSTPVPPKHARTASIPFTEVSFDSPVENGQELYEAELGAIKERRGLQKTDSVEDLVGLCCSGGGIRSATLCLGAAQKIAEEGLLSDIDYLSTVSGGGYFGGFLSSYCNDADKDVGLEKSNLPFDDSSPS
ncbi:MAG: hypothetical protein AAF417_18210, partial [Pseudomonadota bacterium]